MKEEESVASKLASFSKNHQLGHHKLHLIKCVHDAVKLVSGVSLPSPQHPCLLQAIGVHPHCLLQQGGKSAGAHLGDAYMDAEQGCRLAGEQCWELQMDLGANRDSGLIDAAWHNGK